MVVSLPEAQLCICDVLHSRTSALMVARSKLAHPCCRLASPLYLGPAWMPRTPQLVVARRSLPIFAACTSCNSASTAQAEEVFVTTGTCVEVDGYAMIPILEGAIEARFMRLATSQDLRVRPGLRCVDLDSPSVRRVCRSVKRRGLQGWSLLRSVPASVLPKSSPPGLSPFSPTLANLSTCQPVNVELPPRSLQHPKRHPKLYSCAKHRVASAVLSPGLSWRYFGLSAQSNAGNGECFWLSLCPDPAVAAALRQHVAEWLHTHSSHCASSDSAALSNGCLVTEQHVDAAVQACPEQFSGGLVVFHEPTGLVVHYQPSVPPQLLSARALCSFTSRLPLMLRYSEMPGARAGHFERLVAQQPPWATLLVEDPKSSATLQSFEASWFSQSSATAYSLRMPAMSGGMCSPAPVLIEDDSVQSMFRDLQNLGLPAAIALQAAQRHPQDVNLALDWATSSERRHNRPHWNDTCTSAAMGVDLTSSTPPFVNLVSPCATPPRAASPCTPSSCLRSTGSLPSASFLATDLPSPPSIPLAQPTPPHEVLHSTVPPLLPSRPSPPPSSPRSSVSAGSTLLDSPDSCRGCSQSQRASQASTELVAPVASPSRRASLGAATPAADVAAPACSAQRPPPTCLACSPAQQPARVSQSDASMMAEDDVSGAPRSDSSRLCHCDSPGWARAPPDAAPAPSMARAPCVLAPPSTSQGRAALSPQDLLAVSQPHPFQPFANCLPWSCLESDLVPTREVARVHTQELLNWCPVHNHPTLSLEDGRARSLALLQCATRVRRLPSSEGLYQDPSLFAIRVYQIQQLAPFPVSYDVARAAASNHLTSLEDGIALARLGLNILPHVEEIPCSDTVREHSLPRSFDLGGPISMHLANMRAEQQGWLLSHRNLCEKTHAHRVGFSRL